MADDEVGSLAEELRLLARAISAQDPEAPESVLRKIREYVGGGAPSRPEPDVQRIELS